LLIQIDSPWLVTQPSGGKPGNGRDLLPSTTEYLFEGAKMSLALLKGVADLIPVPYVALAFEAASRLFEAGDVCPYPSTLPHCHLTLVF